MKIFLAGATGFIGSHVLRALIKNGHQVIAAARNPKQIAGNVETLHIDFAHQQEINDWLPHVQDVDVVINCVGIIQENKRQSFTALHHQAPKALFEACEQTGVKRVIQVSALGADAQAETPYHLSKRAADQALMQLEIDWYVLRPSVVYGSGGGSFALFNALAALPVTLLPDEGKSVIQPIHIDDLTQAVLQCVESKLPAKQVIDAVGEQALSLREFLQQLRHWQGLGDLRVLSLPYALFVPLAIIGEKITIMPLNRDTLRMLQRGNHADVQPFANAFGFMPQSLQNALAPPTQAERWQAGLYFLHSLLLLSIALTWISAGLVSAFFYPTADSYDMLQTLGISGVLAPVMLYGAAALDVVLGEAMLHSRWLKWAVYGQISVMLFYTLLITLFLPEYWLHPFGPVVKNLPLLVASLILLAIRK